MPLDSCFSQEVGEHFARSDTEGPSTTPSGGKISADTLVLSSRPVPEKKIREMAEQSKRLQDLVEETKRLSEQVDTHLMALRSGTTAGSKKTPKKTK